MKLNEIKNKGNWSDIAGQLNTNFGKISTEVDALNNATKKNKGFYSSLQALKSAHPTSSNGSIAYVREGDKFKLYAWDAAWVDTGMTYTENIELGDYYTKDEIDDVIGEWNDEPIANVIGDRYGEDQDFNLWGQIRETKGRVSDAEENIDRLGNQLIDFRDFAGASIDNNSKIISAVGQSLLEETERAKDAEKNIASLVQENADKINILNELSATKAELNAEAERAEAKEQELSEEIEYLTPLTESSFRNMGALAYPEFSQDKNWNSGDVVRIGGTLYRLTADYVSGASYSDEVLEEYHAVKEIESNRTNIDAIQKSVWGGEEKVVFDAYEVSVIAPLMQTSVVGGGIIVYVRNPNTDNEIANGFFYKLNGSYYRDALIDGVDILLPLRDEQRKLYPEKNYVCNGKTYYVDNNFLSLTMKSSISVFEESTEEAIEEMIANGTWKEGVIYYTVEE